MKKASGLPSGHTLTTMRFDEIELLASWAKAEGWNPGGSDIVIAHRIDPEAFIALRDGDELVGGGTVFRVSPAFGFMGLFIVRSDRRGAGLGRALWHYRRDRLLARLQPSATIGMDGVLNMVPFYTDGGFRLAHRDMRFEGIAYGEADPDVSAVTTNDFAAIMAMDADLLGTARPDFLSAWLNAPGVHAAVLRSDARPVVALGVMRPALVGYKFGPVLADSPELARRMVTHLLSKANGLKVQLDVPEPNAAGQKMAESLGLQPVFSCARMYHGPMPKVNVQHIFGVTSFEFG
jgi:GNAT superfamily N-acetyltransferase